MKAKAKIQKWGNGLAIRIGGIMRDIPRFKEGMAVEVEVSPSGLNIQKVVNSKKSLFPYTEAELLKNMTPQSAHAELLTNPIEGEY